jgi:two-component system sensor histidine kinase KdpD
MTTMNVQHIESFNDDIARITDVRVTETVPDKFLLTLADEIVDVDLPVDELLERLEEGKVYPKERVAEAITNFFRSHNLTALREVSLREVAKSVGARSARTAAITTQRARDKGARERIMVAMGPYTTNAKTLLRKGSRLAGELNTDWDVVTVISPRDEERNKTIQEIQIFNDNKDLARSLGGKMVVLNGVNVAHMLLDYARNNRIGRIVIGRTWRPMIERLFKDSIMKHIMSEAGPIDIYVVNFDEHIRAPRR